LPAAEVHSDCGAGYRVGNHLRNFDVYGRRSRAGASVEVQKRRSARDDLGSGGALQNDIIAGAFWNHFTVSYEDYENWLHQQTAFEETAVFATDTARFAGEDATRTIPSARASVNFFSMLGARLAPGRAFSAQDPDAVVVSYEFWKDALGGDPNVVGRTIRLDGGVRTVVGVLPSHFDFAGYGTNTGPPPQVW
jgi:MacB-like periplasmic core domain